MHETIHKYEFTSSRSKRGLCNYRNFLWRKVLSRVAKTKKLGCHRQKTRTIPRSRFSQPTLVVLSAPTIPVVFRPESFFGQWLRFEVLYLFATFEPGRQISRVLFPLSLRRMLRQGLRRCGPVRRAPFSIPAVSQCQARVSQVARTRRVAVLPPLRNAFHLSRILSQEAGQGPSAAESTENASEMPQFMAFREALNHGVHPNLIRAITDDMRYTHMSEVQERTLQASLKGKDM